MMLMINRRDSRRDGIARPVSSQSGGDWARRAVAALAQMSAELRPAIERDELVVYGQPVMDLRSGLVAAVESLVRWSHPGRGVLTAGEFLYVAEAADLMHLLECRVLRESCRIASSWVGALGESAPSVHVNVSGSQLEAGKVQREVLQALTASGLDPSLLVLEIPHAHLPMIGTKLRSDLQDLRALGVRMAIDDLGVGYRILTRSVNLPIDIVKIDMSFVGGSRNDPAAAAVIRSIFSGEEAHGLEVIVKNVETQAQSRLLSEYGCRKAQGFFYSRPMAELELMAYLAGRRCGVDD